MNILKVLKMLGSLELYLICIAGVHEHGHVTFDGGIHAAVEDY